MMVARIVQIQTVGSPSTDGDRTVVQEGLMEPDGLPPKNPDDPLVALTACHAKIRQYMEGLTRLVTLPDLRDPRVIPSAQMAVRYFSIGLPLHAADEDDSIAPRLATRVPGSEALLDALELEHGGIDACLARLIPLLSVLAEGGQPSRAALRAEVGFLRDILLPHIEREEAELFPLLASLTPLDRAQIGREMVSRRV
jgi:hypothetical protein